MALTDDHKITRSQDTSQRLSNLGLGLFKGNLLKYTLEMLLCVGERVGGGDLFVNHLKNRGIFC